MIDYTMTEWAVIIGGSIFLIITLYASRRLLNELDNPPTEEPEKKSLKERIENMSKDELIDLVYYVIGRTRK